MIDLSQQVINEYIARTERELLDLIKAMCRIPAPSNHEEARARFVKDWFMAQLGDDPDISDTYDVYIDDALNCALKLNIKDDGAPVTVFMAHTDTVFPDMEPFEVIERDGRIYCPGVGDNTANLAMMMLAARFIVINAAGRVPNTADLAKPTLFVANSGEEGLGNLKGCKKIMKDYEGRVAKVISFDGNLGVLCDRAVGSIRYEIKISAEGGHSYSAFGATNAIVLMARLIDELYKIEPPKQEYGRATYNVGRVSGGTSVNTIAESAEMLFEVRATDSESLERLERDFYKAVERARPWAKDLTVTVVGQRPTGSRESSREQKELAHLAGSLIESFTGQAPRIEPMSTDCNIPLATGIPAVALGAYHGGLAHNRGEWIETGSLSAGLKLMISLISRLI